MTTIWNENAARFATSREDLIDRRRRAGIREYLYQLRHDRPAAARLALHESIAEQLKLAGVSRERVTS